MESKIVFEIGGLVAGEFTQIKPPCVSSIVRTKESWFWVCQKTTVGII
jgi:hypothetical protein